MAPHLLGLNSRSAARVYGGELPERTNGTVSKTVEVARPPRVQIPYSPLLAPRAIRPGARRVLGHPTTPTDMR